MALHPRILEQGYMKEQKEVKENHLTQQSLWLLNNTHFCYGEVSPTNNDNKENLVYDILAEPQVQDKKIILCKVLAHIGIKGNEESDKAVKQEINMPGLTISRLHYTDYYLPIRGTRNSKRQREWENNNTKLHYNKPRIEVWESAQNSGGLVE